MAIRTQRGPVECPVCGAPERNGGCPHLALAADLRTFIRRCVEASGGMVNWRGIREIARSDFTCSEEAFAREFLEPCPACVGVTFGWQNIPGNASPELHGWVWATEPRKLWWELADRFDEWLASAREVAEAAEHQALCPICGADANSEDDGYGCEHLVISADDCDVVEKVIQFANAADVWKALRQESKEDYVENFAVFVAAFIEGCDAAAGVAERMWDGGCPGLSGVWTHVWTADAEKLKAEIRAEMDEELGRIRNPKSPETTMDDARVRAVAERIFALTVEHGGTVIQGNGDEPMPVQEDELEDYPTNSPQGKERRARRKLLRLAKASLDLCGEQHPLCVKALDALQAFCEGRVGYRELAMARSQLGIRVAAAGGVGLPHRASNAAATLACFHCCHPLFEEAVRLTQHFYKMTREFAQRSVARTQARGQGKRKRAGVAHQEGQKPGAKAG